MDGMQNLGMRWRQIRFNPLRSLTPERLSSALDSAAAGWLREAALIYEVIEQRESIVKSVMGKRRGAVARCEWQIVVPDPDDPRAEAHREALEFFYNNLTVTDATDLNVRTGFAGLVRQMMDAVMQNYAAHEIIWQPSNGQLTAEMRRVPMYFFENRTGRLRFVGAESRGNGEPLDEDGWMTTVTDGLGEALAVCYMFKRLSIQDLIAYSEKFSIPGVIGRTRAAKDSPEGIAARDSALAFSSDWVGMVYNDDGAIKDPIQIISAQSGTALPPMTIAEYFDRAIATLVRGGDLSSISRKDGVGSNNQEDELAAILQDDCAMISETLQTQLDRKIIAQVFGDKTPAAYILISPPSDDDLKGELQIDEGLLRLGVRQNSESLAERYGRELGDGSQGEAKAEALTTAENAYNPLQARIPKGSTGGGQWTEGGYAGKTAPARRGKMRKGTDADRKKHGVAPAFTDLQVTDDPDAELLATAKNANGKTVYYYSEERIKTQEMKKFARISALHKAMPKIQAQVDADILSGGPDKEQALAVRMISLTGIRNGGEDGGGAVETFGASNLQPSQARVVGDKVHLDFVGKKGVRQRHSFTDPALARHISAKQAAGAERVFDGNAAKTLGYMKKISGNKFKVHDLRTWHGTMLADATAAKIAAKGQAPSTPAQFKAFRTRVAKVVGRQLGNNAAMSLKAYIHPLVFAPYEPQPAKQP